MEAAFQEMQGVVDQLRGRVAGRETRLNNVSQLELTIEQLGHSAGDVILFRDVAV